MDRELRILLVEDVPADAELEVRELKRAGLRVTHRIAETEEAIRLALREFQPDIILSDFSMPKFDGMAALALAREFAPEVPFIFVSGTLGEDYAIRALKNGATDYVLKNNLVRLPAAVERALQEAEVRSARRQAEEEISRQRTFLRQVIDLDRNRIFAKDREGRFTLVNQAYADFYGCSVEGALGKTYRDINPHAEEAEQAQKVDLEVMNSLREVFIPEQQFTDAEGRVRWFQIVKRPLLSADGKLSMVLGVATEITERKRNEEALRESEYRLDLALEASDLATWEWNFVTREVRFSRHWWPILGYQPDQIPLLIEAWEKLTHPDDLLRVKTVLAAAIKGAVPILDVEYRMRGKSGEWRWIRTVGRVVQRDAAGRALRMTGTHGDITERKLVEEKIRRLNRVYAVLSGINTTIVRVNDRQELFNEACRIAVEHGNFAMAWIGMFDPATQDVTPVAWAGEEAEALTRIKSSARDGTVQGQGAVGRAIRERRPVFNNDIVGHGFGGPRHKEIQRLGFQSQITLPLYADQVVVGVLTMYAREPNFFDEEELRLLTELAGDISFALENMARQQQLEKLSRIRSVSSEINAAIVRIHERQALLEAACRIASEHGKFEMVWIGAVDAAKQEIRAVAWTGFSQEAANRVSWKSTKAAQGTLSEAIQTRKPSVRNDIETELPVGGMRAEALKRGCGSTVCLPLVVDDHVVALVVLFANGKGFFDEDELALLDEVASDISLALQSISRQEKVEYLSYYDALTGLPNRTLFNDRLDQRVGAARDEEQLFSVIMLDIERFRLVNDTFGRQAGDDLLRQISRRLKNVLQKTDLLAHFGGDHFAIATHRAEEAGAGVHIIIEQILTALSGELYHVDGNDLRLTARAGIAVYPVDGPDVERLYRNAEAALKNAKRTGQRYQFYAPEMNARVAEQLKLENDLRNALPQEQYVLYYQPRFNLSGGGIVGLEALIRWMHPERGMVSPAEFIPLLEETGMILEVGRWALTRAALDHAAWSAAGFKPPRIAVNVSQVQLRRKDFVDHVKEALAAVDRAAERIDIEITESMLMEDIEGCIEKLKAVQSLGLNVAVDDFGTGYSSLSYLARLPINSLKIDRSFIIQMNKGPEQMAIVSTVISLARALNLKVVAEGVETEEQASLLRLLRCDEAQGYLFGKPLPPGELEKLLGKT